MWSSAAACEPDRGTGAPVSRAASRIRPSHCPDCGDTLVGAATSSWQMARPAVVWIDRAVGSNLGHVAMADVEDDDLRVLER